jgi:hypothetical protein
MRALVVVSCIYTRGLLGRQQTLSLHVDLVLYRRTPPPLPSQWVVDSPPVSPQQGHPQANESTRHEEGYPPGFDPVDLTTDAGPPTTPPVDTRQSMDNDVSTARRLENFINKVTRKRASLLIREPPKPLLV